MCYTAVMIQNCLRITHLYWTPPPLLCKCFIILDSYAQEQRIRCFDYLASSGIEAHGGQQRVYLYIYIPFIVYLDWTSNRQCCSQVDRCKLFISAARKGKNKRKNCETFWNSQSASGRKPADWVQKAKSFTFGTGGELGNSEVKGQQRGSLIKKEREGEMG